MLFHKLKKIKLRIIILTFVILFGFSFISYATCQAASASVTLSTDSASVTKGEEVTINIQLSSEDIIGDFIAYVSYNDDVLEFNKGASFIAGGDGLLKITDMNAAGDENSRKYAIIFTAKKVGNSKIAVKENPEIYDYESGLIMSASMNELNINVVAAKETSTNTNLKSLKISPGTLKPDFKTEITEYSAKVSNNTDELIISAIPEDDAATITTNGNKALEVGKNEVTVTVKAESGHTKKYAIQVIREEPVQTADSEDMEETADTMDSDTTDNSLDVNSVQINDMKAFQEGGNIYIQNGFRYQIAVLEKESDIPEGYIKTTIDLNDITIDAYSPKDNPESEFLLIYAVNEKGEKGFYQYDRVEKTIQRFTKNQVGSSDNKYVLSDEIMNSEDYHNKITTMGIIIGILGALLIIMSILLIHVYTKPKD